MWPLQVQPLQVRVDMVVVSITDTRWEVVLPLSKDALGVFLSPSKAAICTSGSRILGEFPDIYKVK